MKIEILGTGCPKCKKLNELVEEAASELGVLVEIIIRKEELNKAAKISALL